MKSDITSRRVTWIALALSLLSAGVGHVYCGRIRKALPLYFAWLLVPLCCIAAAMGRPSAFGLLLLLLPTLAVVLVYVYAAADACRIASQIGSNYEVRDYNRASVYGLLIVVQLILSIGLTFGVRRFIYEAYVIPVNNMSPTILAGDRILARKLLSREHFPERGDLIVYRNPDSTGATRFMGRVVAVAGDLVEIRGDRLSINGKGLERNRVPDESLKSFGQQVAGQVAYEENSGRRYLVTYGDPVTEKQSQEDFEAMIPKRHVFVLGDNRDRSRDSRHFGSIHAGDIIGYVEYIYWPTENWSRFGLANDRLPKN